MSGRPAARSARRPAPARSVAEPGRSVDGVRLAAAAAQRAEPVVTFDPRRTELTKLEPRKLEARKLEPRKIGPRKLEPMIEPSVERTLEPRKLAPRDVETSPVAHAPVAKIVDPSVADVEFPKAATAEVELVQRSETAESRDASLASKPSLPDVGASTVVEEVLEVVSTADATAPVDESDLEAAIGEDIEALPAVKLKPAHKAAAKPPSSGSLWRRGGSERRASPRSEALAGRLAEARRTLAQEQKAEQETLAAAEAEERRQAEEAEARARAEMEVAAEQLRVKQALELERRNKIMQATDAIMARAKAQGRPIEPKDAFMLARRELAQSLRAEAAADDAEAATPSSSEDFESG